MNHRRAKHSAIDRSQWTVTETMESRDRDDDNDDDDHHWRQRLTVANGHKYSNAVRIIKLNYGSNGSQVDRQTSPSRQNSVVVNRKVTQIICILLALFHTREQYFSAHECTLSTVLDPLNGPKLFFFLPTVHIGGKCLLLSPFEYFEIHLGISVILRNQSLTFQQ